jgi:hypothetical protein
VDDPLPDGWTVWNEEPGGRVVLAFRPDVFEGERFPPECLPTLYVSRRPPGQRRRRAGQRSDAWHVAFYLEPEVRVRDCEATADSREGALAAAREVAASFADGAVDPRASYQVPREEYIAELERLTGRASP